MQEQSNRLPTEYPPAEFLSFYVSRLSSFLLTVGVNLAAVGIVYTFGLMVILGVIGVFLLMRVFIQGRTWQPQGTMSGVSAWAARRLPLQWLMLSWAQMAFRRRMAVAVLILLALVGTTSVGKAVVNIIDAPRIDGITFVNFKSEKEKYLRRAMAPMFSNRCTEAFTDAKLRSPAQVAAEEGVMIRPANDLFVYSARELGLVDERTRTAYSTQFSSGRAQSGSVPSQRFGVPLTIDGRPRIFLHDSAFTWQSWLFSRVSLREALIHEFVHIGNQPPTPGWLGPLQHDLAGFEHYDIIMKACS